jgi:hypothetical protein
VDTLWSDVSEFQVPVNDSYPHHFLVFRSNDGSYLDHHFTANIDWARGAVRRGRLWGFGVYYFYRPGANGAQVMINRVGGTAGKSDPHLVAMIDVEGAGGQVGGNQSGQINREYNTLARWLGDRRRVFGYGNVSDLNSIWPNKPPGIKLVVAAYGSNPSYGGKFAHQYTDHRAVPPFGPSDHNSADGMSPADLQRMFGIAANPAHKPPPATVQDAVPGFLGPSRPLGHAHVWKADGTMSLRAFAARRNATVLNLLRVSAENLPKGDFIALNNYVIHGVGLPMPRGLAICTVHA